MYLIVLQLGLQKQEEPRERNETLAFPYPWFPNYLPVCISSYFLIYQGVGTITAHCTKQSRRRSEVQLSKNLLCKLFEKVRVGCRCSSSRPGYQTQSSLFLSLIQPLQRFYISKITKKEPHSMDSYEKPIKTELYKMHVDCTLDKFYSVKFQNIIEVSAISNNTDAIYSKHLKR